VLEYSRNAHITFLAAQRAASSSYSKRIAAGQRLASSSSLSFLKDFSFKIDQI